MNGEQIRRFIICLCSFVYLFIICQSIYSFFLNSRTNNLEIFKDFEFWLQSKNNVNCQLPVLRCFCLSNCKNGDKSYNNTSINGRKASSHKDKKGTKKRKDYRTRTLFSPKTIEIWSTKGFKLTFSPHIQSRKKSISNR